MKTNLKENYRLQKDRNRIEKMFFEYKELIFEKVDGYRKHYNLCETSYESLISVGIVTLFKAIVNFNCENRMKFSYYARTNLDKTMERYLTRTIFPQNSFKRRPVSLQ